MTLTEQITTAPKPKRKEMISASDFRQRSTTIAHAMLRDWVGEERAREATGRIATAISASAAAAKNPTDFYECTPQSIAKVIAISALTGIMVSTGQAALAYAIPRRPRTGEQPQLQYQLSHRGIAALARRAGLALVAYPISVRDEIDVDESGEVLVRSRDIDNPPQNEEDLRGVVVLTKSTETGVILSRGFVAKSIINIRRLQSDSYRYAEKNAWAKESSPWHKWYVEMAIKSAMHYAIGRGWCVIDDTEAVRALSADVEGDCQVSVVDDRSKARIMSSADLTGGQEDAPEETDAEPGATDAEGAEDAPPTISEEYEQYIRECEAVGDCEEVAKLISGSKKMTEEDRKHLLGLVAAKRNGIQDRADGKLFDTADGTGENPYFIDNK